MQFELFKILAPLGRGWCGVYFFTINLGEIQCADTSLFSVEFYYNPMVLGRKELSIQLFFLLCFEVPLSRRSR